MFSLILVTSCEKEVSTSPPTTPVPIASIFIDSNPRGAKIYENGKNSGKFTPDSLNWLEEKTYRFTLKKELYRDTSFSVVIKKDEKKELFIDYFQNKKMYGLINFISKPDSADIFLNGDSTGLTTPDTIDGVIPGNYHVVYRKKNCITDSLDITVRSNEITDAYKPLVDTTYWVEYSSANSAIPSDNITTICVDLNNIIWMGSSGGAFSFNGTVWKQYTTSNSLISNNFIRIIRVDSENNIWIGTFDGLNKYTGSIWYLYTKGPKGLPSSTINDLFIKENNKLLVATGSGVVEQEMFGWNLITQININGITRDKNGDFWYTTPYSGIVYYNTETGLKTRHFNDNKEKLYSCVVATDNEIWFGHHQSSDFPEAIYGLSSVPLEGYFRRVHYPLFDRLTVYSIKIRNDEKWICTDKGLYILFDYPNYKRYWSGNTPLTYNIILDVAFDNNGNAWVATGSAGLYKFKIPW